MIDEKSRLVETGRQRAAAGGTDPSDDPVGGLPLFDRRSRIESLAEKLRDSVSDSEQGGFATKRDVVDRVLLPLLRHLGWDVGDTGVVAPGFETPAGAVDFALCHPSGDPRVLVKIGAVAESAPAPGGHPFEDCSIRAVQLAISEDGRSWEFHFPAGRGSVRNRQFARFDIANDLNEDVAEVLDTHLSFHAARSGEAFREAERAYGERRFPAEAPGAWRRSVAGREVVRRFLREMEDAVGVPADRRRAMNFVRGQLASMRWPADPPDPKPARRVEVGDRVWVYDFESREIVARTVVGREPDWERGEVSRDSPVGHALLGAREGEENEIELPDRKAGRIRIVLIRGSAE